MEGCQMPLKFNVVTNIDNGYGLEDDYLVIKNLLQSYGHEVVPVHYNRPGDIKQADINIFLETIIDIFGWARENWYFPNPEWFTDKVDGEHLHRFKHVLCKTLDGYNLFKPRCRSAYFCGFENRDYFCPGVAREWSFLHVAGQSVVKNTDAVIDAWQQFKIPWRLTIIATKHQFFSRVTAPNIIVYRERIPEDSYVGLLNCHQYHICASQYEGWGHSLHDARSVGAIIITTSAPPMNEYGIPPECLVPSHVGGRMRLANLNIITASDLADVVRTVAARKLDWVTATSKRTRENFLTGKSIFRSRFKQLVDDAEERLCLR
jgi:hypothetical protein